MRILFTTTRGAGHFNPLVPFADACVRAGHEVLVAGPSGAEPQARRAGLPFSPIPEPPEDELEAAWSPVFSLPLEKQDEHVVREVFAGCHARAALPGTLELIERWGAELIVRESAEFSGAIAAERLGVPYATVGVSLAAATDRLYISAAAPVVDEPPHRASARTRPGCRAPAGGAAPHARARVAGRARLARRRTPLPRGSRTIGGAGGLVARLR